MKYSDLLQLTGDDPVFESSLLLSLNAPPEYICMQLSRWVNAGKILQIRRGLYSLAVPYRKTIPHPYHVASRLQPASYISLQTALAYYGLIPVGVNRTICVTSGRPETLDTPLGGFEFRHIKPDLFFGYQKIEPGGQTATMALPEKALFDLLYLHPGGDGVEFLQELHLQNLHSLDTSRLILLAERYSMPKIWRGFTHILDLIEKGAFQQPD